MPAVLQRRDEQAVALFRGEIQFQIFPAVIIGAIAIPVITVQRRLLMTSWQQINGRAGS